MNKRLKVLLCVIGIFLVTSILIGISYAYYVFSVSQSESNAIITDCFRITYTDENPINLNNQIPLGDKEAKKLTPYTFTITNVCNHAIDYDVNIETLNTTTVDLNGVRVRLNNFKSQILGSIEDNDSSVIYNSGVLSSKTIKHGSIVANGSKTYDLRVYIDENSTVAESASKSFSSKVVVSTRLNPNYSEGKLVSGAYFNSKIKKLVNSNASYYTADSVIKGFVKSDNPPLESDNYIDVSDASSDYPIYAWFNDEDSMIYLYSKNNIIYMNENIINQFYNFAGIKNLDLSMFDTSKVNNMSNAFSQMINLETINFGSNFDTSNVKNMSGIFRNDTKIANLDVSFFDTTNVTDMSYMFYDLSNLEELNLGDDFNTSKVTDMSLMFASLSKINTLDLSMIDTSNVSNMSSMFENIVISDLNLSTFNTSKVTNMSQMFNYATINNLNLLSFDTSNVIDMSCMFENTKNLEIIDISSFDTSNVTKMGSMFYYSSNLKTVYVGDNWSTSNVNNSARMFEGSTKLVGGAGTTYSVNHVDAEYARIDDPDNGNPGYFTLKTN